MRSRMNVNVFLDTLNVFLKRALEYVCQTISHQPLFRPSLRQERRTVVEAFLPDKRRSTNTQEACINCCLRFIKTCRADSIDFLFCLALITLFNSEEFDFIFEFGAILRGGEMFTYSV